MAKRTGPTNPELKQLILELRKQSALKQVNLWKRLADDLEMSTRKRRIVNLSRINRYTSPNETVIVPGKVLGSGMLNHTLTVAAYAFSESAKQVIENTKGSCLSIQELVKKNPEGKNVRIIG